MLTATAAEMVDTDQPNSSRSGSMSTPGTARNAAAPTSARKVTAATHQAGWIRRSVAGRGRSRTVTTGEHDRRTVLHTSGRTDKHRRNPATPDVTIDSPRRGTDPSALWLSRGTGAVRCPSWAHGATSGRGCATAVRPAADVADRDGARLLPAGRRCPPVRDGSHQRLSEDV